MTCLIPVIELPVLGDGNEAPEGHAFWERPEIWDDHYKNRIIKAGFSEEVKTCQPGMPWFEIVGISEKDLSILVDLQLQNVTDKSPLLPFYGGYILVVDGRNVLYPQCCGDLSDISYWEAVAKGVEQPHSSGHPEPMVHYSGQNIILEFNEWEEPFCPPCPVASVEIERQKLSEAISGARVILKDFGDQLIRLNDRNHYGIEDIDEVLIRGWR